MSGAVSGRVAADVRLPVPVLRTASLARSAAWYAGVPGFAPAQVVPGVVALLRLGDARLQLWQSLHAAPQDLSIALGGGPTGVFDCHARIARAARAWIRQAPVLTPWGTWEFTLADLDGNLLRFACPAN
ncbi:MAG: hypothetical protein V4864_13415 [Pseudomonadota bacterium]